MGNYTPEKIVYDGKAVEASMDSQVNLYCVPLKVNANCNWKAVKIGIEQNILAKSVAENYLPVFDWMESVVSIILGVGTLLGGLWKFTKVYHLYFPGLRTG